MRKVVTKFKTTQAEACATFGQASWEAQALACAKKVFIIGFVIVGGVQAETGYDAWLRYAPVVSSATPAVIVTFGDSKLVDSARQELIRGVRGMLGRTLRAETGLPKENAIVLGTLADLQQLNITVGLNPDGYLLRTVRVGRVV